ncbi:RNA-guided endonuclease InsQ/TnpB family protein [Nonomuraea bangladeshensis]|uniref:RNA-guided endonuclease InsQ/TnpB family protein n=1 Tax=Nonomuraea bangladeshensis TaxID=404385 RepID=UPI003C2EE5C0
MRYNLACSTRRTRIPRLGEVRLHNSAKRLARLLARGEAVVQSVTVSRGGDRWYASVLCKVSADLPKRPTRRQTAAGVVGLDLGVTHLVALSQPADLGRGPVQLVNNPRHLAAAQARLRRAQRAWSRTQKGSARRGKAKKRLSRLHEQLAVRRAGFLHQVTKRLATGFGIVAVEDLHVAGMTRSARGTVESPGRNVRQKAGLNRAILDTSPAELRRQLTYKTSWYGSTLAVLDRWFPSSKTCSACGRQNPRLTLADRVFTCVCGLTLSRDLNAARNIAAHAVAVPAPVAETVAPDRGETSNARGASVSPPASRGGRHEAMNREDAVPSGGRRHPSKAICWRPTVNAQLDKGATHGRGGRSHHSDRAVRIFPAAGSSCAPHG